MLIEVKTALVIDNIVMTIEGNPTIVDRPANTVETIMELNVLV